MDKVDFKEEIVYEFIYCTKCFPHHLYDFKKYEHKDFAQSIKYGIGTNENIVKIS